MLTIIRDFSYEDYKALVEKYITYDSREINFQNRVILPFLEFLLKNHNIDVVDTSTLYNRGQRNAKTLDNSKFMKEGFAPPDLILAKNWHLDNVNNVVEYLCALEIKSPVSARGEQICGKEFEKYRMHVQQEVQAHLEVNPIVILTDCYRWQFFDQKTGFIETTPIDLVDQSKNWIEGNQGIDKWKELCEKLADILGINGER